MMLPSLTNSFVVGLGYSFVSPQLVSCTVPAADEPAEPDDAFGPQPVATRAMASSPTGAMRVIFIGCPFPC